MIQGGERRAVCHGGMPLQCGRTIQATNFVGWRAGQEPDEHAGCLLSRPCLTAPRGQRRQILRRHRRPLLLCLEYTHRPARENHVRRTPRLGKRRLFNMKVSISHQPHCCSCYLQISRLTHIPIKYLRPCHEYDVVVLTDSIQKLLKIPDPVRHSS
jgi:hypothetical protein